MTDVESEIKTGQLIAEALAAHLERMRAARTTFNVKRGDGIYLIDIQLLPQREPHRLAPPKMGQIDYCSTCGLMVQFDGHGWGHLGPLKPHHQAVPTHPWGVSIHQPKSNVQ